MEWGVRGWVVKRGDYLSVACHDPDFRVFWTSLDKVLPIC